MIPGATRQRQTRAEMCFTGFTVSNNKSRAKSWLYSPRRSFSSPHRRRCENVITPGLKGPEDERCHHARRRHTETRVPPARQLTRSIDLKLARAASSAEADAIVAAYHRLVCQCRRRGRTGSARRQRSSRTRAPSSLPARVGRRQSVVGTARSRCYLVATAPVPVAVSRCRCRCCWFFPRDTDNDDDDDDDHTTLHSSTRSYRTRTS